jgi:hypothetical protein
MAGRLRLGMLACAVEEEADVAADEQPEEPAAAAPDPAGRPAPRKPDHSEKALTLQVARLFGISPQVLMNRSASPQAPSPVESITGEEDGAADADADADADAE